MYVFVNIILNNNNNFLRKYITFDDNDDLLNLQQSILMWLNVFNMDINACIVLCVTVKILNFSTPKSVLLLLFLNSFN